MQVVHIVPALFGFDDGVVGGAERYALELARQMAEQVPTTLVSFGDNEKFETLGRLKIHVIGDPWYVRGNRNNPVALSLFKELREADVVHCHQQHVVVSSLTALLCRLLGRRVFVTELGGGGIDISTYISTDRWYHGHLHISEYSRKIAGHLGESRAYTIYGGVDTEKFSPDASITRNGSALFVGRLLPHKGIDGLIEALPAGMPLEVVGQPYDSKFAADLRALSTGKSVTFVSDCDDEELVSRYRRAMCVVLPSVYKNMYGQETTVPELLGQTLLEGMACGAPAICTDVASMPEVVVDGATGFIVPPHHPASLREKLHWLRDNPEQARAMGKAARNHILEKFTWPVVVRRCLEIYAA